MNNKYIFLAMLMAIFNTVHSQSENMKNKDHSMFPDAEAGMKKAIIHLEKKENEQDYKIELIASKIAKVDNCNQHHLSGQFIKENLKGWGYHYHKFNTKGFIMSTRMGCSDNTLTEKEVFSGRSEFVRYNSRLPIVVYIPEDCMLKYKVWTPGEMQNADPK